MIEYDSMREITSSKRMVGICIERERFRKDDRYMHRERKRMCAGLMIKESERKRIQQEGARAMRGSGNAYERDLQLKRRENTPR